MHPFALVGEQLREHGCPPLPMFALMLLYNSGAFNYIKASIFLSLNYIKGCDLKIMTSFSLISSLVLDLNFHYIKKLGPDNLHNFYVQNTHY